MKTTQIFQSKNTVCLFERFRAVVETSSSVLLEGPSNPWTGNLMLIKSFHHRPTKIVLGWGSLRYGMSTSPKMQNSDETWLSRPCVPGVKTLSTVSPVILTQEQWSIWIIGCKSHLVFALCLSLLLLWGFEAPRVLILLCFLSWATIKIERHIVKAVRSVSLYFWQLCITKVPPASGCPWQSRSLSKFHVSWASLSPRWECLKHKGIAWDRNDCFKIYVTGSKCII